MTTIRIQALLLVSLLIPLTAMADEPSSATAVSPRSMTTDGKRDFLKKQLTRKAKRADVAGIHARLDRMSPEQLDKLVNVYERKLARSQRDLQKAAALRDQLRRQLQMQRGGYQPGLAPGYPIGGRGVVGYRPVLTWLPQGTSLGVSGVVSPDRRSVRISANPFFSHIPNVDTFNFRTGETRRYPQPAPEWPRRTSRNATQVEKYFDGLRTRYRRPQN